ncbi:hypothetical protein HBJ16_003724 [Pseudomonas sp. CES]|nr:hypothetical protein HBJ16_003724 [Pseudomonas sp. CES]
MPHFGGDTEGLLNFIPAERIVYFLNKMLLMEMGEILLSEDA